MIDPKYYAIPRYLNEPMRITIFTLGEAIPALIILLIMIFMGLKFIGVLMGGAWIFYWKMQKAGRADDFIKRKLAWNGLIGLKNRMCLQRKFIRGDHGI